MDATVATPQPVRFRMREQVGIAVLAAVIAPFTALAWPFALLTGFVIGGAQLASARGERATTATRVVRVLAVTGGVMAMMVFGLFLGGLISFLVAALAALSEQRAAGGTQRQQAAARILVVAAPTLVWLLLFSGRSLS